jgi:hypothetical protein
MRTALFYEELGKLVYAIALADESITPAERETITKMVTERLLHKERDTDRYGTNEAWITEFSFETAEENGLSAEEAMGQFMDFVREYRDEISEDEMNLYIKMGDQMADAFHHINKKENKMLGTLRSFLMEMQASRLIF